MELPVGIGSEQRRYYKIFKKRKAAFSPSFIRKDLIDSCLKLLSQAVNQGSGLLYLWKPLKHAQLDDDREAGENSSFIAACLNQLLRFKGFKYGKHLGVGKADL